jgi:hypothetical protein
MRPPHKIASRSSGGQAPGRRASLAALLGVGFCLATLSSQQVQAQSSDLDGAGSARFGGGGIGGGIVSVNVTNAPLEDVLGVLRRASGYNIRATGDADERREISNMRITLHLERAFWRDVLSQIARDIGNEIDRRAHVRDHRPADATEA